ncbi:MAG: hypothetical protein ACK5XF_05160 [Neisseriaceae bacterium]
MVYINFVEGFGSVLSIFPTIDTPKIVEYPKYVHSTISDDKENLAKDWNNIGEDIRKAMDEFETTCETTKSTK